MLAGARPDIFQTHLAHNWKRAASQTWGKLFFRFLLRTVYASSHLSHSHFVSPDRIYFGVLKGIVIVKKQNIVCAKFSYLFSYLGLKKKKETVRTMKP